MPLVFGTLSVHEEGAVLFAEIAAPPMNLLGPELVTGEASIAFLFRHLSASRL